MVSINYLVVGDILYGVSSLRFLLYFSEILFLMICIKKVEYFVFNLLF